MNNSPDLTDVEAVAAMQRGELQAEAYASAMWIANEYPAPRSARCTVFRCRSPDEHHLSNGPALAHRRSAGQTHAVS